jgi:hypothetical protein
MPEIRVRIVLDALMNFQDFFFIENSIYRLIHNPMIVAEVIDRWAMSTSIIQPILEEMMDK